MADVRKLLISPIDIDTTPIVRYSNLLHNYSLQGVVAPTGWGYVNKDVSSIDGGQALGIIIDNDFEKKVADCDSVLFNFSNHGSNLLKYLKPQIEIAANMGKEILISDSGFGENKKSIEELKNLYHIKTFDKTNDMDDITIQKELFHINTPIILVSGLGERCNKFETQLSLKEFFMQEGYNVCQIGSKDYSNLFGFEAIPRFIFDNKYSTEDKIYLFNHYIKELERNNKPDVFIIGVPGGIMPFNQKATNHFGMLAYIVSNAIRADAVILNLYFDYYLDEYFKEINNYCRYKYDFNVICHGIANTKYDFNIENVEEYITFLSLDSRFTTNNISQTLETKWNIFNIFKDREESKLPQCVYNALTGHENRMRNA